MNATKNKIIINKYKGMTNSQGNGKKFKTTSFLFDIENGINTNKSMDKKKD